MDSLNRALKYVSWTLTDHPDKAVYTKNEGSDEPVPNEILRHPVPAGNILVLAVRSEPLLVVPFSGGTFRQWMTTLHRGLTKPIKPSALTREQLASLYMYVAGFRQSEFRNKTISKLEKGELCPINILGDHKYFEGHLKKTRGVWTYAVGS